MWLNETRVTHYETNLRHMSQICLKCLKFFSKICLIMRYGQISLHDRFADYLRNFGQLMEYTVCFAENISNYNRYILR
jgi:hypothetical protein